MGYMDKVVVIDRMAIKEVEGISCLVIQDDEGQVYQMSNCLKVNRGCLTRLSEIVALLQEGDVVKVSYSSMKTGALNLDTVHVLNDISFVKRK